MCQVYITKTKAVLYDSGQQNAGFRDQDKLPLLVENNLKFVIHPSYTLK